MKGVHKGQPPYGFRWSGDNLVCEPEEAATRRLAFELFRDLKSKGAVARSLNQGQHLTRRGNQWSDIQVGRILACPSAIGNYQLGASEPEEAEGTAPATSVSHIMCEALIPLPLWEEVTAILAKQRETPHSPAVVTHALAGIVYCGCGEKMRVPSNTPKFVCPNCQRKIPVADLDGTVAEELAAFVGSRPDMIAALSGDGSRGAVLGELRAAKTEMETARAERSKVETLFLKEQISATRFGELHQALDQKLERAAARVDSLEKDLAALPQEDPPDVWRITQALPERWRKLPAKEARKLTRAFVERITLGEDDIEITFRFGSPSPKVVASGQQTSAPTEASAIGRKPGDPVYVRLPKSGKRCPHSGLTRSKMNELILPTERNGFRPPVASKSIRKRGSERGIRLVLLESLIAHLAAGE